MLRRGFSFIPGGVPEGWQINASVWKVSIYHWFVSKGGLEGLTQNQTVRTDSKLPPVARATATPLLQVSTYLEKAPSQKPGFGERQGNDERSVS